MHNPKFYFFTFLFFISIFCFSQSQDVYNALLVPQDLKTKANAVVRFEKKTIEIVSIDEIKVTNKRITTVFNKYGNRHINAGEGYDDDRKIENIQALIYDAFGEEIKKIKERDFVDASAVSDFSIYEDNRVKYLNYIPLKYPYTVEYKSEVIFKSTAFFPNWLPIDNYYVSVQHSEYEILNTVGVQLKVKKENFGNYNIQEVSEYHFIVDNIESVNYEAYTPELKSILPRFKVALRNFEMLGVEGVNNNWSDFGKWMYDKLLTGTDEIPQATKDYVKQLTIGVDDKIERAKLIYKYMQDKTRYISIQVGIGGWKPMLADDVDKLGYADCKGLTNYTKALLEAVDVPSYYTVVYGGKGIRNMDTDFSSLEGNHVILCVPNDDENIFLECTSQTNPFGFSAGFTDDRKVLLVKPEGGEIAHTKIYEADDSIQKTSANIIMDASGSFTADVSITTSGYQYNIHEGLENQTERDQLLHYKEYWDNINNIAIDNISIANDKDTIIYTEKVQLSSTNYASKSGSRLIFEPNMFNKVTNIPPRYEDRKLEFKIDRSFKDEDEFIIHIPEGLRVEAMTESKKAETKFGSYKFNIENLEGNKLKYTRTYILNKGNYEKEDYKAFRDFRKLIVKHDKTKVVLTKVL
jgi:transglutaminase-like putative cysteine protease